MRAHALPCGTLAGTLDAVHCALSGVEGAERALRVSVCGFEWFDACTLPANCTVTRRIINSVTSRLLLRRPCGLLPRLSQEIHRVLVHDGVCISFSMAPYDLRKACLALGFGPPGSQWAVETLICGDVSVVKRYLMRACKHGEATALALTSAVPTSATV